MLKTIFKYAITISLIALILLKIDTGNLWSQVKAFNPGLFIQATVLIIVQIYFLGLRWHDYINVNKQISPLQTSIMMTIMSHIANILFISSAGGIIAKSALAIRQGLNTTQAIIATFIDRFMTLLSLLILSLIGMPLLEKVLEPSLFLAVQTTILGLIIAIIITAMLLRSAQGNSFMLSSRGKSKIFVYLRTYLENYPLMKKTTFYSLIAQICFVLSVFTLSLGLESEQSHAQTWEFIALIPVLALVSSLPISLGGWGVREGAFVYGLGMIGFSPETAFILSIQVGLVTLIAPLIVSIPCSLGKNQITSAAELKQKI